MVCVQRCDPWGLLGNTWYVWLWPSMEGVPAIIATTAYYRRKFAPKVQSATAA